MSSFLESEVFNPFSLSRDYIQVIKENGSIYEYHGMEKQKTPNILGVLVFSILFGAILSILGEEGKPLTQWFSCHFNVTMKMVEIVTWYVLFL